VVRSVLFHITAAVLLLAPHRMLGHPDVSWRCIRTPHFELYAQGADEQIAHSAAIWFEALRSFFIQQIGLQVDNGTPARVIAFQSEKDYTPYRIGSAASAFFVRSGPHNYIVLSHLGSDVFPIAAHEYAHLAIGADSERFPAWLNEGLAEFLSTVHIGKTGTTVGDDIPARSQALRQLKWMPLDELLPLTPAAFRSNRDVAAHFYAQSWALTQMLLLSPQYVPGFHLVVEGLASGSSSREALTQTYHRGLDAIEADLRTWTATHKAHMPVAFPPVEMHAGFEKTVFPAPLFEIRTALADLLLAAGEVGRAQAAYQDLAHERPRNGQVAAALGGIALRNHNYQDARLYWRRALDAGLNDADLCYDYAALADRTDMPVEETRAALERAIALKPAFDDARYQLALLESNARDFTKAISNLKAMKTVAPARAFHYWTAMAYALTELGRSEEAVGAANSARRAATTDAERSRADELAYLAQTDLNVRFVQRADGRQEMITTRVPQNTRDWNPFVEPGDDMRHIEGNLQQIQCESNRVTGIVVAGDGTLTLSILDPGHIQIKNGPSQVTCGPQTNTVVAVDYAISRKGNSPGIVRGIDFKQTGANP
jgi:tetratricopeptide (TPR) repeat protein